MPGIKAVIAQHVETLDRQVVFAHIVNIFVVSPGDADRVQSAPFLVNTVVGLKTRVSAVRIFGKELLENNRFGILAAGWEGVSHHGPLRLAPDAKDLPEIVDKPS